MRILITGGTGFVGRSLVAALIAQHDLTLLLREDYGGGKPLPGLLQELRPNFETAYADLRNFQLTARAVRAVQPDVVVHLAAAGVTDPFLPVNVALSHNLTGTLNLVRACFELGGGPDQLIVARTPGELSAMNVYAASKAAAWDFCQMYARTAGWPIHGAMVFQAYGSDQPQQLLVAAALRAALAGEDFPMTEGSQEKDWIHRDDIVAGLIALLGHDLPPGTTVDLGTGEMTSVLHVVEMIFDLANRGGRPLPGVLPSRPGEVPRQQADTGATMRLIGWQAQIPLQEGLAMLVRDAAPEGK